MNLSPRWVHLLQGNGFEAYHWSQKGSPSATDAEIMAFAAAEDFVVLTHTTLISAQFSLLRMAASLASFRFAAKIWIRSLSGGTCSCASPDATRS
jgi:hypothetical protein